MRAGDSQRRMRGLRVRCLPWRVWLLLALLAPACAHYHARNPSARMRYEDKIGREFAMEASAALRLVDEPEILNSVQAMGRRMADQLEGSRVSYRFFVVRDPTMNAFAVPGGYIYMFAGLLARVQSENELAGVLAHEIGHVEGNHFIRGQKKLDVTNIAVIAATILAATLGGGESAAAAGTLAQATQISTQLHYSREFEREADRTSIRLAHKAGYDPQGILSLFNTFHSQARLNASDLPPYFSTHPLPADRIYEVQSWIQAIHLPPPQHMKPIRGFDLARLSARLRLENHDELHAELEQAVREHPDSARARFLLGFFFLKRGDLDAARTSLGEAYRMDETASEHALYLARALQLSGRDAAAGALLDRVLEEEGASAGGPGRATVDVHEAEILLVRVLQRDPQNSLAEIFYGDLKAQTGQWDEALDHYRKGLALAPDSAFAHRSLGMACGKRNQIGESYYHLGLADKCAGRYLKALYYFRKALKHLPARSPDAEAVREEIEWLEQ